MKFVINFVDDAFLLMMMYFSNYCTPELLVVNKFNATMYAVYNCLIIIVKVRLMFFLS